MSTAQGSRQDWQDKPLPPPPSTSSGMPLSEDDTGIPGDPRESRRNALRILTKLAHGSAPFLSAFLIVHLSAPIMANVGGSSLASQVMLLGREYYQTSFGHRYLVVTPLLVHTASSLAKRLLAPRRARSVRSLLTFTGYVSAIVFFPVHYLVHRVYPSDPLPPIDALSPSELDFEYVKYGLATWPIQSWILYAGLIGGVAFHAVAGGRILWNTYLRERLGPYKAGTRSTALTASAVIIPVLAGLWTMTREPLMVFSSSIVRFDAAFRKSPIFRL